ncbi:MAG TPA: hypothetical protein VIY47_11115 [Ignavibacteriaceae bacterium]
MGFSSKNFLVQGEDLVQISDEKYTDFYFFGTPWHAQAGKEIQIVTAIFENKYRKPSQLIECYESILSVMENGCLDPNYNKEDQDKTWKIPASPEHLYQVKKHLQL